MVEDVSDLLGAVVGDFKLLVCFICREGLMEAFLLTLREPITRGAQEKPDVVEGIACASGGCQSVCVRGLIYKYAVNLSG